MRRMVELSKAKWLVGVAACAILLSAAFVVDAQAPGNPAVSTPAIRISTRLVTVDAIVTDKSGKPVTDLTQDDFIITENGKRQKVALFSLERRGTTNPPQQLPEYVYSNRPEFSAPAGQTNILLVDALNTPWQNQSYARQQLLRYVGNQLRPGDRVAVYALGTDLVKLQGFTQDPVLLRQAIERAVPQSIAATAQSNPYEPSQPTVSHAATSALRDTGAGGTALATGESAALNSLINFMNQQTTAAMQVRIPTTIEALRMLALQVSGMPGRKNLIWVSALVPFNLFPQNMTTPSGLDVRTDPTAPPPLPSQTNAVSASADLRNMYNDQIRRVTTLLSDAQVAIYPVDALGIINPALAGANNSGLSLSGHLLYGQEYAQVVSASTDPLLAAHGVMEDLAAETGGRAFFNRNDIDNAVANAASDGSTYYALGYYPDKKKFDGDFRKIKVEVKRPNLLVRHRQGYFAIDPAKVSPKDRDMQTVELLRNSAVQSTMVTFDAQLIPPPPANGNTEIPVKVRVPASSITTDDAGGGKKKINLDFFATAFASDGKLAANIRQTVDATLEADQFAQVEKIGLLLPMSLKLGPGSYEVRLAVRDNRTGYVGTLSIPLLVQKAG